MAHLTRREQLRQKTYTDAASFETDRLELARLKKVNEDLGEKFKSTELSSHQKLELQEGNWQFPKHLFRVASSKRNHPRYQPSKGLDTKDVHVPGVLCLKHNGTGLEKGKYQIANSLVEETDLCRKVGDRLMWKDKNNDSMHSWTPSFLFVLVLGLVRQARCESDIHISSINAERASQGKRVDPKDKLDVASLSNINLDLENGKMTREPCVKFYSAERLLNVLDVLRFHEWRDRELGSLKSNWFTGEWLSHGIVMSEEESYSADFSKLLKCGLLDLHDQFLGDEEYSRMLYERCVRTRSIAFAKNRVVKPMTVEELQGNSDLASIFLSAADREQEEDPSNLKPPLHIFLSIVGLKKRLRRDPAFIQWIKARYTRDDVASCGYEKTKKIANNLPEVMEAIELARDACVALEMNLIPPIPVWLADSDFDFDGRWLHEMERQIKVKEERNKNSVKLVPSLTSGDSDSPKQGENKSTTNETPDAEQESTSSQVDGGEPQLTTVEAQQEATEATQLAAETEEQEQEPIAVDGQEVEQLLAQTEAEGEEDEAEGPLFKEGGKRLLQAEADQRPKLPKLEDYIGRDRAIHEEVMELA